MSNRQCSAKHAGFAFIHCEKRRLLEDQLSGPGNSTTESCQLENFQRSEVTIPQPWPSALIFPVCERGIEIE